MSVTDIYKLYSKNLDHISFLKEYSLINDQLMYYDIHFIHEVINYLKFETINLTSNIPIYKAYNKVDKSHLSDKCLWYSETDDYFTNYTSGSTGSRFEYRIWRSLYDNLEGTSHYGAIAREFNIKQAKILYLHQSEKHHNMVSIGKTTNPLISFGLYNNAEIHYVYANNRYYKNHHKYYEDIIKYSIDNNIDIIHTKSNIISSLAWAIKKLNIRGKICKLISNTGSKVNIEDLKFLQNNNSIDNWCDNMRCWDGGVTFYTCKYNTYHLMDNLSYAYADEEKLRSIDYFSIPSLFVNYWNGDYVKIGDSYNRCKCGRAFRDFEISRTRSLTSSIASDSQLIINKLIDFDRKELIKRIDIVENHMRFITSKSLSRDQLNSLKSLFPNVCIDFAVEE